MVRKISDPEQDNSREFRFKLGAFSKDAFPMATLAEYLSDLAVIYGHEDQLHFLRLEDGSTVAVARAELDAAPEIEHQLELVRDNEAPVEVMEAVERLDARLRRDRTSGEILSPTAGKILNFPGVNREVAEPLVFGPFNQPSSLEGVPIMVGGKGQLVPVHLEDLNGNQHICYAKRPLAKEIAVYLFSATVRVEGMGRWLRHGGGDWELKRFTALDFKVVNRTSIEDDIARLQAIPGKWKELEDPLADMNLIRHEDDVQ